MRLLKFMLPGDHRPRLGALDSEDRIIDLSAEAERDPELPFDASCMVSLAESGKPGLNAVRDMVARVRSGGIALRQARLLAPIPRPRKNVMCVGWNYLEHFQEGERIRQSGQELPAHPVFFTKTPTAVIGPFDAIPHDAAVSDKLDWEVELGVIIGRAGKNIPEELAYDHVFGYTVINDVSARDLQRAHGGQWFKGKSLDGTCPMGPVAVTADYVDPNNLRLACRVNGVVKQDSSTRYMYFKISRVIAELSRGMTLEPGDVISTGTPPGVGFARTPPEYLKPGDVLETEIEGIGVLRNIVSAV
ncbi:MAG TPA: fumarylacetoacetate hydrolase family protein [Burkholderiales bacterium]|nr:fumarylacetoacetate hydrolase family protein [Burkholderiales bacterium]